MPTIQSDALEFTRQTCVRTALAATLACLPLHAAAQPTARIFASNLVSARVSVFDTSLDTTIGAPIPLATNATPRDVAVTPDGRYAYVLDSAHGSIQILDVALNTVVGATISGLTFPDVYAIAITPDGHKAYVAGLGANVVYVLNLATNTIAGTIPTVAPYDIAFTPDGHRAVISNFDNGSFTLIDVDTDTALGPPVAVEPGSGNNVAITPDGRFAYMSNPSLQDVWVIDINAGSVATIIAMPQPAQSVAVSPDGTHVYVTYPFGDAVGIIETATNTVAPPVIATGTSPIGIVFEPGGATVYTLNYSAGGTATAIRVATGTVQSTTPIGDYPNGNGLFISPRMVGNGLGLPTSASSDADLDAMGFNRYIPFIDGGTLKLTGNLTTSRSLSMLLSNASEEGFIDTGAFNATVSGTVTGNGVLVKLGSGTLTLTGDSENGGGTSVGAGTLVVTGTHTGNIGLFDTGTGQVPRVVGGTGTTGLIDAIDGAIAPGVNGPGILHAHAANISATSSLVVEINGPAAGTGYDRLETEESAAITGATLVVQAGYTPAPGTPFTILTRASGTFDGLPEGTLFQAASGGVLFRISYHGGTSGFDVVLTADLPPTVDALADRTMVTGQILAPVMFNIADDLTPVTALTVSATSSNRDLVPDADLVLSGSGASRTLAITPVPGVSGSTVITVTVSDGTQSTQRTFTLTVTPVPVYYLAEGATGPFFSTDLLLANPNAAPADAEITFYKDDGSRVSRTVTLGATSQLTLRVNTLDELKATSFSTSVASPSGVPLLVERTMWWGDTQYGASSEKASPRAAAQWYFAEGSQGFFHSYFLLLNPHAVETVAHVTYFIEGAPAVQRDYTVAATSRRTIDAATESALINRSFGALITFDLPGMAERAMYFGTDPLFSGGSAAAGVTAPATNWFLAEGATGSFFDTFVLIANPNDAAATLTVTYLPATGQPIVKTHPLPGHQRLTLNIATEDDALASAAVSTRVASDLPVIVERSQYWPHGSWYESHNSAGETAMGTKWGLAEGRVGGNHMAQTYILIANPGTIAAEVTATFLRADGTTVVKTFTVPPTSRFNIAVTGPGGDVPELADESFGTIIESTQPVIVERSLYTDAGDVIWAAGTNATGSRLPE